MIDKIKGLIVVLEDNTRVDDIGPLANAIRQMRGVLRVGYEVSQPSDDIIVEMRTKTKLMNKVLDLFKEEGNLG